MQKHLQLHDLSFGEYITDNYALWLDFRTIDENTLHGMVRKIGREVTLQIEKKSESAGALKAYIYLIMAAQLNIQNGAYVSAVYKENANNARTSYSPVCGSNRSRKNTFSLEITRAGAL